MTEKQKNQTVQKAMKQEIQDLPPNEQIIEIETERLRDFQDHPFRIKEDEEMKKLMQSISRFGIL